MNFFPGIQCWYECCCFQSARDTLENQPTAPPLSASAASTPTSLVGPAGRRLSTVVEVHESAERQEQAELGIDEIARADSFQDVPLNDDAVADAQAPPVPPVNDSGDNGLRRSGRVSQAPVRYRWKFDADCCQKLLLLEIWFCVCASYTMRAF